MNNRHVRVLIDDETIYDKWVDSGDICYSNKDGQIQLLAGPLTCALFLRTLVRS